MAWDIGGLKDASISTAVNALPPKPLKLRPPKGVLPPDSGVPPSGTRNPAVLKTAPTPVPAKNASTAIAFRRFTKLWYGPPTSPASGVNPITTFAISVYVWLSS